MQPSALGPAHLFYFDSGVGGLSGVKAIRERGVRAKITYIGDSLHVPYGRRSESELESYGRKGMEHAASLAVDLVVPVCHNWDRKARNYKSLLPAHSEYIPLIETAAEGLSRENSATVIAAVSSNNMTDSREYTRAVRAVTDSKEIVEIHGHNLPSLVEKLAKQELASSDELMSEVKRVLAAVPKQADLILHACTHFPFLDREFGEVLPHVKRVSAVDYQADEVVRKLGDRAFVGNGETEFLTTGNADDFFQQITNLLHISNPHVEHISDYGNDFLASFPKTLN